MMLKWHKFYFAWPSSTSFAGDSSILCFNNSTCSSKRLFFVWPMVLESGFLFSASIAQLYTIMPRTATVIPNMFFTVSWESKSSHPNVKIQTVFMWPKTWKVTAEKRPMQRYWLTLQNTANEHERSMKSCTNCNNWFSKIYASITVNGFVNDV